MRYQEFLARVVEESKRELVSHWNSKPCSASYLKGSEAGLQACLNKSPPELTSLVERAHRAQRVSHNKTVWARYLWIIGYLHEVAWICEVISTALVNQGMPPIVQPSVRAAMLASRVSKEGSPTN